MRVPDRYFLIVHHSLWVVAGSRFMDFHVQNRYISLPWLIYPAYSSALSKNIAVRHFMHFGTSPHSTNYGGTVSPACKYLGKALDKYPIGVYSVPVTKYTPIGYFD